MEGVNQCQYSPRHLDLLFEQLWRHSTWATPPPVVGCSAALAHPQHLDQPRPGLHNSFNPAIQDGSMWSKFGARGEHGDVFPVLQLRCARILRELNQISIAYLFKGGQEQFFSLQTLLFTAFLVTVLKNLTYALVST